MLLHSVGIDIEMTIERSYLEAGSLTDGLLKHVFRNTLENYQVELDNIKRQFNHDDLTFPEKIVVLSFHD